MGILKKALYQAHDLVRQAVKPGDAVVDATMGNGNDTLFLAGLVGDDGRVFAFDIQQKALDKTQEKLEREGLKERCRLILDGHQNMKAYVEEPVSLVIFNLGYLPGGDHTVGTRAATTRKAVESALELLKDDGMVILVIYYGGDSGFEERDEVLDWLRNLDCRAYSVLQSHFINQINCPPILIAIEKNGRG